ncbi:hypothetical protein AAFF_G00116300 [Aldrovandia affinis]|uniref:Uncharacterized protein n=1 Tax=Aldrovandia affinis TaxID=143900 RepID=A0AAD7WYA2_9TELE|nr:hypothetical protein AAFF_G00116300 [Aldrovandia affinis]
MILENAAEAIMKIKWTFSRPPIGAVQTERGASTAENEAVESSSTKDQSPAIIRSMCIGAPGLPAGLPLGAWTAVFGVRKRRAGDELRRAASRTSGISENSSNFLKMGSENHNEMESRHFVDQAKGSKVKKGIFGTPQHSLREWHGQTEGLHRQEEERWLWPGTVVSPERAHSGVFSGLVTPGRLATSPQRRLPLQRFDDGDLWPVSCSGDQITPEH